MINKKLMIKKLEKIITKKLEKKQHENRSKISQILQLNFQETDCSWIKNMD